MDRGCFLKTSKLFSALPRQIVLRLSLYLASYESSWCAMFYVTLWLQVVAKEPVVSVAQLATQVCWPLGMCALIQSARVELLLCVTRPSPAVMHALV